MIEQKTLSGIAIDQYEKKFAPMQPAINKCEIMSRRNQDILTNTTLKNYLKLKKRTLFESLKRCLKNGIERRGKLRKVIKMVERNKMTRGFRRMLRNVS